MAPPALPAGFFEIASIDGKRVVPGKLVNVMGIVKDVRLPIPTRGTDHKCTVRLIDISTEYSGDDIEVSIFRPPAEIPQFGGRDVVVFHQVKVQKHSATISLITHKSTKINIFNAAKIPRPPASAEQALVRDRPARDNVPPNEPLYRYVSYLYHTMDKDNVPSEAEFRQKAELSLNVKSKFTLLQDVSDGKFCDIIALVARKPFDGVDKVTIYVSDYTENPNFFHYTWEGVKDLGSRAKSDPYGYTDAADPEPNEEKNKWLGPYGKKALQITCYEPHARHIRELVSAGDWVRIRNLQIKYGHDGRNLEGYLREDRGFPGRINIDVLDTTDRQTADPALVEAVRRWRDFQAEKTQQIKQVKAAEAAGVKRNAMSAAEEPRKKTRSQRKRGLLRKKQAQIAQQQGQPNEPDQAEPMENEDLPDGLSESITCEGHPDVKVSTVADMFKPCYAEVGGKKLVLPFICAKYLACVRVVDFYPPSLEQFACSRKQLKYEALLTDSEDSDDDDGDSSDESMDEDDGKRIWEWQFALRLEDARNPGQRLWAVVDNYNAQCLMGLDACDLTLDGEILGKLRERMFLLWGDLEEKKSEASRPRRPAKTSQRLEKPLDSSDHEDDGNSEGWKGQVSNQPFVCCIQQYGVREKRAAPVADKGTTSKEWARVFAAGKNHEAAGNGEWTRVFAMFGTKILC